MDNNRLFKTANLALCPFLVKHGLEYIGTELEDGNETKIVFIFRDPQNRANDIAMLWPRSDEAAYHSTWAYFRNALSMALKKNFKKG